MRWLLGLLWTLLAFGVVASTAIHAYLGDRGCEAMGGGRNYGELSWSLVPPGKVCTWTEEANGFAADDGPHLAWSMAAVYLVVAPVVVLIWFRGDDDGHDHANPDPP